MDPFTAVGLAASLIQFIDFSSKLVAGSVDLYQSTSGALSVNLEFEAITEDLHGICTSLIRPRNLMDEKHMPKAELELLRLSRSCAQLAREFISVLEDLKSKNRKGKWDSVRQALKTQWKKKDIDSYRTRLENYRSAIAFHLLSILSDQQDKLRSGHKEIVEKQSRLSEILEDIAASNRRLELSVADGPLGLKNDIVASLQQFLKSDADAKILGIHAGSSWWNDLPSQLSLLASTATAYDKQLKIIESLRFVEIWEREEHIEEAHRSTFDWLFLTRSSHGVQTGASLLRWLRDMNGIYWVSGKAGSGKSTLMKYLHKCKEMTTALERWAYGNQLITASFYFWHAGSSMQKSQQGLLQTLLYYVLRACPQLVQSVCPGRWHGKSQMHDDWTRKELYAAFALLKSEEIGDRKFCFFIDGLDEYKGDHVDIINIINSLASGNRIKILFSSRPWHIFENAYGENSGQKIQLHENTTGDIRRFVLEKFAEDPRFSFLKGTDSRYEALIKEIVRRANGVFLWVVLVVKSLLRGLINCDTIEELHKRLEDLPSDLEEYFQHMLDSTERVYQMQAARIYQMCLLASGSLDLTTLSFFDRTDSQFCLGEEFGVWTFAEVQHIRKKTQTRVMARCTDLLEVSSDSTAMVFLHRTVHDFLTTRHVQDFLEDRAGYDFDASFHLSNAVLCELKHLSPSHLRAPYDEFKHCTALVRRFMTTTHQTAIHGNREYLSLVDELELTVERLQSGTIPTYSSLSPTNLAAQYPKGWVVEMAIKESFFLYLSREKRLGRINKDDKFAGRPPLDIALRPNKNSFAFSSPPKLSAGLVTFLLELDLDPNTNHENSTVWLLFLQDLRANSYDEDNRILSSELTDILERLLKAGADPAWGNEGGEFATTVSKYCTPDATRRIDELRIRILARRTNKTSVNAVCPKSVTVQSSQKLDFRRARQWFKRKGWKNHRPTA